MYHMGLFSYIRTTKNEKAIQGLLDCIRDSLSKAERVRFRNLELFSTHEISTIESNLCAIVDMVREIENICDNGDRKILRCTNYKNDRFPPRPLGMVVKDILERVIQSRISMNQPPFYQEEIDVFMRYQFD